MAACVHSTNSVTPVARSLTHTRAPVVSIEGEYPAE